MHNTPPKHCEVCQRTIGPIPGIAGKAVCKDFDCIRLVQQAASLPPLLYQSLFATQSKRIRDKQRRSEEIAAQQARITQQIEEKDAHLWQQTHPPEGTFLASVGTGDRPLVAVSQQRRDALTQHLDTLVEEALADIDYQDVGECRNAIRLKRSDTLYARIPLIEQQADNICATCRGSCCFGGNDTGFLSATLFKARMSAPNRNAAIALKEDYLARVPEHSVTDSCIFHGGMGCNLPKTMRSVVCNGYLCPPVEQYQTACEQAERVLPVFAISHRYIQFRLLESPEADTIVRHAVFPEIPYDKHSSIDADQEAPE